MSTSPITPSANNSTSHTKEAKEIASGGGIVFAASVVEGGGRLFVTWLLSGFFGAEVFGVYTLTITTIVLIKMFSSLGTELGSIYFGAKYRQQGELDKLKGLVISSLTVSTVSGIVCSVILWFAAPYITEEYYALRLSLPGIIVWTPLHTLVGLLRAQKDMKGNALVYQITIPLTLIIGSIVVVALELDLYAALITYWISLALSLIFGIIRSWKHFYPLLSNPLLKPVYAWKELLTYSIPMAFSQFVFRLNAWMDILMLGWLSTNTEVGIYRIAVSLSIIATLSITSVVTIFNPIIVELVEKNDLTKLNSLLKLVTKWIILFNAPLLMAFYIAPDAILFFFDNSYLDSEMPLIILTVGQFVWSACSIAMRVIPMSGYAMLNLANGIVAGVLNMILNYILIPKYGGIGAAIATSTTLVIWSLWRLVELQWLLHCFPFHKASTMILVSGAALSVVTRELLLEMSIIPKICITTVVLCIYTGLCFWLSKEEADQEIITKFTAKFRRLFAT